MCETWLTWRYDGDMSKPIAYVICFIFGLFYIAASGCCVAWLWPR